MTKTPKTFFFNKTILVFGGTGSWGSELLRQLLTHHSPKEVRVYSRDEHKQVAMRRIYKDNQKLKFIIGDVRDGAHVRQAMHGVDIVYNLAALKHVPVCEGNVWEAVQTNITGPQNVVNAAMDEGVEVAVQVSTDKAVEPYNLYGFTKGIAEKIFVSANFSPTHNGKTKFVCVRGGNVLSTTGSVIPLFIHLIRTYNKLSITDKNMSRFFMRVSHAIELVLKATTETYGGEIFVLKMPGAYIMDLAHVMIRAIGNKYTSIEYIGIRPGEKLYEMLVSKNEAPRTVEDGDYRIILPEMDTFVQSKERMRKYISYKHMKLPEYTSLNTTQLDQQGIQNILEQDEWLGSKRPKEMPYNSLFSPYK